MKIKNYMIASFTFMKKDGIKKGNEISDDVCIFLALGGGNMNLKQTKYFSKHKETLLKKMKKKAAKFNLEKYLIQHNLTHLI